MADTLRDRNMNSPRQGGSWLFFGAIIYLLSQAYMIPIAPIGLSWTIWPTLPDLATAFLAFIVLFVETDSINTLQRDLIRWLILIYIALWLSFIGPSLLFSQIGLHDSSFAASIIFGIYPLYRALEFIIVFIVISQIRLTPSRKDILRKIVTLLIIWSSIMVILTGLGSIETSALGSQIPTNDQVSGQWAASYLRNVNNDGLGVIGYNRAHVGVHLLVLIALHFHLIGTKPSWRDYTLLVLILVAAFLTQSRASFAAVLLFTIMISVQRPISVAVFGFLGGVILFVVVPTFYPNFAQSIEQYEFTDTINRQISTVQGVDDDNLSGRNSIWDGHIDYLNEKLFRWFVGGGVGATSARGAQNGHMLPLHILIETGLIGLVGFAILTFKTIIILYRFEDGIRPILLLTLALLFSSITQETFYPVPAQGHFIGIYLFVLALTLGEAKLTTGADTV